MLKFLFALAVFALSLGQFAVVSRGDVPIYLFDLFVGIYTLISFFYLFSTGKFKIHKNYTGFLLFGLVALLSLVPRITTLTSAEFIFSLSFLIRFLIYLLSGVVTYNLVELNIFSKKFVYTALVTSGIFIAMAGFIQLAVLPDFTVLDSSLGWDPHKNRLASTFFDPNFTAGYLSIIFALTLNLFLNGKKKLWPILFILLVAIFLTFSRSGWAMLSVIIFIYGILKKPSFLILGALIIFSAYFFVPRVQTRISGITDPADSAAFRLISWQNAVSIFKEKPMLGVGFNSYRFAQQDHGFFDAGTAGGNSGSGSDSSFLLVLATTGIIGFAVFVLSYFFPVLDKNILVISILSGLFLQTQFINAFFYPQIMFVLFSLLSI